MQLGSQAKLWSPASRLLQEAKVEVGAVVAAAHRRDDVVGTLEPAPSPSLLVSLT